MAQMLDVLDKNFRAAIINILRQKKRKMWKNLKCYALVNS